MGVCVCVCGGGSAVEMGRIKLPIRCQNGDVT